MKRTVLKYAEILFLTFLIGYLFLFCCLPSRISIVQGAEPYIDSLLPVSISSNAETDGEIEYDFSSYNAGAYDATVSVAGMPIKKVTVNILPDTLLVPCGNVKGFVLDYDGVMVLGTGKIDTADGKSVSPAKGVLKTGDIIKEIDGTHVESRHQAAEMIEKCGGDEVKLVIERNGEKNDVNIKPALSAADEKYKIGCWIRGETQGLGTITYINKKTGEFGALGHGVYDADAKKLLEIENGVVTDAEVSGIKKGEKGTAGEISGVLDKRVIIGEIEKNTVCGVFGKINNTDNFECKEIEIMPSAQIKEGKAVILSTALNGKTEEFEIEIESIGGKDADKSMMIRITDSRLIDKTGGIVQGMSGSPICQNGKIVGAVTHVLVNDPTRGYGIFIENMLEAAE